ncbi:GTPase IMAP family member 8-like isoform X1 [Triplophysa dalaica]|uniref:GTPase IMAP family member 8-like isoform X1 n=1 Tax=Triplophysa dalaica TaxID=1582913 RepID=UPI0024DF3F98|nr:GTPase IMAP family member 8-like isoform X1 [Triplophysa dalaica]XP_056587526.1 GTPase IMAP family member 8-like isoform X1 [Triplophysa dalaica]
MSDQRTPHHMVVQGRNSPTSNPDTSQSEIRMVMTGGRQLMGVEASGKSSAGNIILGRNAFDTSRRTARSVQSTGNVHGRRLTVVDTPGWWWHYSVEITPKFDRRELIRSPTLCLPGPHAFLLVIPVDLAFPSVYRITLEQQLKFLSKEVWRHIIVLFTSTEPACDESSLKSKIRKWPDLEQLLKRCHNRYHILNINNKSDNTQVITLLEKIEKMVAQNNGHHFKIGRNIYVAGEREKETRERANQRVLAVKRQRSELRARFRDGPQHLTDVRIVILGAAWAARSSAGNILLGEEAFKVDDSRTTVCCEVKHAEVYGRKLTVVDTPGWYCNIHVESTSELDKLEIRCSVCLCPPGPHVIILTVPIAITYDKTYNKVLEEHMDILGKKVWNHTIVLFTRGDWLGDTSIEERIENEGKQLQWLIRKCGNRYHVFNCKQHTDNTQVLELLAKIEEMVMENNGCHFVPETDSNPSTELELKMKIANRKMMKVRRQRDILQELLKERKHNLSDVRIVLLGGEGVGKSTSGNVILQANVFKNMQGENCKVKKKIRQCVMQQRKVEEWHVSVVDTPGWSSSALENAKEIAQSVTICSPGPHVFLLVLPAHQSFTQTAQQTVEQLMSLFGKGIFRHTIILFTGGRWLRDRPVEHYTACEEEALQKLIARCGNRYHMLSDKGSKYQVKKLLKLIEEMVRRNRGEYFTPEKKDIKPLPTVLQLLNESNTMRDEWNKREDELIDKMLKAAVVDLDGEESEQPSYRRRESISQSTAASEDSLSESGISIGAETLSPVAKVCSWLEHFTNNGASLVTSSTIQDLNMESATDDLLIFKHNASDMAKYLSKIRERKHGRSLSF